MNIIEIKNAHKEYYKDGMKIEAINNINAKFNLNKLYVIMGNSGSGKTTLIQNLGLLDTLTSGKIYIDGKDTSKLNDIEKAKIRKEKIGFVFQSFYLNPNMKAIENVMLPMFLNKDMSNAERKNKAERLLKNVGLTERINHYPKELSGGEQQRVAIARALANDPDIILADEPTGNLDKKNEEAILDIFESLKEKNKCIIIVSHNEKVKEYADTVIKMSNGKLVSMYDK